MKKRLWLLASGVLFLGLAVAFSAAPALALNPQPLPPGIYFGPMTLSAGQSVRINLANLGSSSREEPPDPCELLVMFVGADGSILNGDGKGQIVTIEPGASTPLLYPRPVTAPTLTSPEVTAPVVIRVVVLSLTPLPASCTAGYNSENRDMMEDFSPGRCNHWVFDSSLEVLDSTGQTIRIINPITRRLLNPQPLPPG